MIEVAKRKAGEKPNPRFYSMDMRDIALKENFDVVAVLFGGFGYLLQEQGVMRFSTSVQARLDPKGLLVFEFWHDSAVFPTSSRPSGNATWDRVQSGQNVIVRLNRGKYDPGTNILNFEISFYVLNLEKKKLVDSFVETHNLRTYSIPEIRNLLEHGGFRVLGFYSCYYSQSDELDAPKQATFRVMAVATPMGK